jgi:hypothetical protein
VYLLQVGIPLQNIAIYLWLRRRRKVDEIEDADCQENDHDLDERVWQ